MRNLKLTNKPCFSGNPVIDKNNLIQNHYGPNIFTTTKNNECLSN